jgi:GT2 family glycosyltransferase
MIDIVTVIHNDTNKALAADLLSDISEHEKDFTFSVHSNEVENLGFAKGCNIGASYGTNPVIGFLNPDVKVWGGFVDPVLQVFRDSSTVITGNRFGKPDLELREWGVRDWVCGAVFFVKRNWFESVGGFDEGYPWAWEETDLIRQAEHAGLTVRSTHLPITHSSPVDDSDVDREYKVKNFEIGRSRFNRKWRR